MLSTAASLMGGVVHQVVWSDHTLDAAGHSEAQSRREAMMVAL